jgi:hypothetical protein
MHGISRTFTEDLTVRISFIRKIVFTLLLRLKKLRTFPSIPLLKRVLSLRFHTSRVAFLGQAGATRLVELPVEFLEPAPCASPEA